MNDEQFRALCLRMAKRDLSAANELDFALRKPLVGFAITHRVSQSDAEDIAQESLNALYSACRNNSDEEAFFMEGELGLSYLFRIAKNKCADWYYSNQRGHKTPVHNDTDIANLAPNQQEQLSIPDSLAQIIEENQIDQLNQCINKLPNEQRTLLQLRFYDDMTLEKTRNHMQLHYDNWNVVIGTVSNRILAVLNILKECLNS